MEVNRIVSIFAGFMVMLSLGLAHWMGQVDLSHIELAVADPVRRLQPVSDGLHRLLSAGEDPGPVRL